MRRHGRESIIVMVCGFGYDEDDDIGDEDGGAYLIFVTGATGGARVNFLDSENFTELTRKIGNLLCILP